MLQEVTPSETPRIKQFKKDFKSLNCPHCGKLFANVPIGTGIIPVKTEDSNTLITHTATDVQVLTKTVFEKKYLPVNGSIVKMRVMGIVKQMDKARLVKDGRFCEEKFGEMFDVLWNLDFSDEGGA